MIKNQFSETIDEMKWHFLSSSPKYSSEITYCEMMKALCIYGLEYFFVECSLFYYPTKSDIYILRDNEQDTIPTRNGEYPNSTWQLEDSTNSHLEFGVDIYTPSTFEFPVTSLVAFSRKNGSVNAQRFFNMIVSRLWFFP